MLTKGDKLPLSDHVIRYISPRYIHDGVVETNGFLRRPNEIASSVNWLECEPLDLIRRNSPLKYHKNGLLAEVNIGFTVAKLADEGNIDLHFIYDPTSRNLLHSLIHGIPERENHENELVCYLLSSCLLKVHPAIL